mmetsp:Transcript_9394/g.21885  ORF Transcript_9394/g.21885 Transcript_9394/m.21885 type:complete len:93 (+) Transcript_9394:163-441(+)
MLIIVRPSRSSPRKRATSPRKNTDVLDSMALVMVLVFLWMNVLRHGYSNLLSNDDPKVRSWAWADGLACGGVAFANQQFTDCSAKHNVQPYC